MRAIFLILSLIGLATGHAQEVLYANDSHTVALFFPSPIRQAVVGAPHFTFSYNTEAGQHFGLLQANWGSDSNLLVITQDGRVYSYGLAYKRQLPETFRFISVFEGIGTETETKVSAIVAMPRIATDAISVSKPDFEQEMFKKGATYVIDRKTRWLKTKRKDGLMLRLKELFYHQNEVYVEVEIRNTSYIDFEVDVLEIYTVNGKKGRRSSHQKVAMPPVFEYGVPEMVRVGQRHSFVYVLPKFTLGGSEKLLLELQEKRGNRMLRLQWD